jgi:cyclopropane-fatty-acyl-phospholipid synthase
MAHYDLGNDFYRLFLDETMTYSSGIFETPQRSLKAASIAKYDRLCRKLDLGPNDHVLEIGTGWGGFALYAAEEIRL